MSVDEARLEKGTMADRRGATASGGSREDPVGFGIIPVGSTGQPAEGLREYDLSMRGLVAGGDMWLYNPLPLKESYEAMAYSWPLQAVAAAFVANIYSAELKITPTIQMDSPDAEKIVRRWLLLKNAGRKPTSAQTNKAMAALELRTEYEYAQLEGFVNSCGLEQPLSVIRALVGMDTIGGAKGFMEVLRDAPNGRPKKLLFCPGQFVKMRPESGIISYKREIMYNPLTLKPEMVYRRFKSYGILPFENYTKATIYFREVGDPRIMSRGTGDFYRTIAELRAARKERHEIGGVEAYYLPATELIPFVRQTPWSPDYGSLPHDGAFVNAMGLREVEELDRRLLNGSRLLPLLLITIAGGSSITKDQLEMWQREWAKARETGEFSVGFFQAISRGMGDGAGGGEPKMEVTKTRDALVDEALGLGYMKSAVKGILGGFRYPGIAIGQDDSSNVATAQELMRQVESQVHTPEREWFDGVFNRHVVREGLGFYTVTLDSVPRKTKDLKYTAEALESLGAAVTPREQRRYLRAIMGDALGRPVGDWMDIPIKVMMAMAQSKDPKARAMAEDVDIPELKTDTDPEDETPPEPNTGDDE